MAKAARLISSIVGLVSTLLRKVAKKRVAKFLLINDIFSLVAAAERDICSCIHIDVRFFCMSLMYMDVLKMGGSSVPFAYAGTWVRRFT